MKEWKASLAPLRRNRGKMQQMAKVPIDSGEHIRDSTTADTSHKSDPLQIGSVCWEFLDDDTIGKPGWEWLMDNGGFNLW
jgi:hypothetical protein